MIFEEQDNVHGQIFEPIFAPSGGLGVYSPSNIFHNVRRFEDSAISLGR